MKGVYQFYINKKGEFIDLSKLEPDSLCSVHNLYCDNNNIVDEEIMDHGWAKGTIGDYCQGVIVWKKKLNSRQRKTLSEYAEINQLNWDYEVTELPIGYLVGVAFQ